MISFKHGHRPKTCFKPGWSCCVCLSIVDAGCHLVKHITGAEEVYLRHRNHYHTVSTCSSEELACRCHLPGRRRTPRLVATCPQHSAGLTVHHQLIFGQLSLVQALVLCRVLTRWRATMCAATLLLHDSTCPSVCRALQY